MPTLIDSNVLLDVLTEDPRWWAWSAKALETQADRDVLAINPIIYAEVSIGFSRIEEVDACLPVSTFHRLALPWNAAFLAGKCFVMYRKRGGVRSSPLPDFYIGAHASITGMTLLTRDAARYRAYFPKLRLVAP
ncbi:MAG: type II toxin-antitoxin system VapC family toxin [Deltaproteobacteria bacterium]|nr:type II toxin-antitoxin system VapC family toxin [Deltaproteobacteria bacterium]